jgi:hypothetical protein
MLLERARIDSKTVLGKWMDITGWQELEAPASFFMRIFVEVVNVKVSSFTDVLV